MRKLEWPLLLTTGLLASIGLLVVYSTGGTHYFFRQLIFVPVAIGALIATFLLPRRVIIGVAWPAYLSSIVLLIAVLVFGRGAGADRWLALGPLRLQPSELAKVSTAILLASHLAERRAPGFSFASLTVPVLICLAPALLILAEPDLSTAVLFAVLLAAMLYQAGLAPLHILLLYIPLVSFAAGFSLYTWLPLFVLVAVVFLRHATLGRTVAVLTITSASGLLSPLVLSRLHEYQRARIRNFLAPWLDPHGVGWNAIQSRIAIGSGRLLGKGFGRGTQNRLGFLPNRHTDFVFSCIGEEFGLAGSIAVIGLFALHVSRVLNTARRSRDRFSALLCTGLATIIGYQVIVNIGMLLGLLPITGIALPFVSYGGSGLVTQFAIVGLVLNVGARPE
ncbi:MAG: FtsW/RodA/SpoVE family cell cycle protein [bacterium]